MELLTFSAEPANNTFLGVAVHSSESNTPSLSSSKSKIFTMPSPSVSSPVQIFDALDNA